MSTQERIDASRANGSKSRGPITHNEAVSPNLSRDPVGERRCHWSGKAISSQNALRHGLTATTILIDGEVPERFEILLAALVAEYEPTTESEMLLVENMAVCKWRQHRIWGLENVAHSEEIRSQLVTAPELAAKGQAERAFYAMRELIRQDNVMDVMSRHETRFDRQYMRALKMLQELRQKNSNPA